MPIEPAVMPIFSRSARIRDGQNLAQQVDADYGRIAELAGCHVNTVGPALAGNSKQYGKASDIFTALNILSNNYFARENYLFPIINGEDVADPTLATTFVFPRAKILMRRSSLTLERVAAIGDLHTLHVHNIVEGRRPFSRNVVEKVFEVLEAHLPEGEQALIRAAELIR